MSSGMPELGSKISLVSKADIRYEGRLFTVDPQECTIALASVRSFGTEDRETQYPVAPQSQVYDYILFRGSDIKDIRVVPNVPSLPNDPAIMQMSVPPTLGGANPGAPGSFAGSMLDLIGGSQQSSSRSNTPAVGGHRKSPTADQGTQAGVAGGSGQRDSRRGSTGGGNKQRNRTNSRTRQRYPSGGQAPHQNQNQHHQQNQHQQNLHHHQNQHHQNQHQQQNQQMHHHQQVFPGQGYGRGGWRGRGRGGRGRGFVPRNKNTLKFDNDYDFEQANTEFEELRSQLAKTKISEGEAKPEITAAQQPAEVDKKDDSGNETGAGEAELDDDANFAGYDRKKSFFDSISCETVERSKGRSQRTDWRTERKLNAETFGVASARRGAWRGRPAWRHHNNPMQQPTYFPSWRPMRGGRGRPGNGQPGQHGQHANHSQHQQNNRAPRPTNTAPAAAAAQ
ncbi:protein LSM14 homolog B isoform X8 [Plodia interpunctella]|uniref:protein LSM14 homolog B isoform X8 n=1 Tax=Plodia interpunctella TaxID=58824 RepID=UPI002367EDEF|nr:protein LSM14 homolog B isoform X8 [Plodia interpunctella]